MFARSIVIAGNAPATIPVFQPPTPPARFGNPFDPATLGVGPTDPETGLPVFTGDFRFPGSPPEGPPPTPGPPVPVNPDLAQFIVFPPFNPTANSAPVTGSRTTPPVAGTPDDQTLADLLAENTVPNPLVPFAVPQQPLVPAIVPPLTPELANATLGRELTASPVRTIQPPDNAPTTGITPAITAPTTATRAVSAGVNSPVSTVTTTPAGVTTATAATQRTTTTTTANPAVSLFTQTATPTATAPQNSPADGRSFGQPTLVPAFPQLPLVPLSTADANPRPFFPITGIDRPTDAVATLDSLGPINTTAGGTAQFTRERTDIADLNSLFRAGEKNAPSDTASPLAGNSFTRLTEALANPVLADQPARVMTQIAEAVTERAQIVRENGNTEIRLRLDPPELGTINIRVHSHNGELRAEITAADPAVRTMIESQLADLRGRLEQSGFDFQSFNLSSGNGSDRGDPAEDARGFAGNSRRPPPRPPVGASSSSVVNPNRGSLLDVTA